MPAGVKANRAVLYWLITETLLFIEYNWYDHMNDDGLAWPSIRRLARETGLSHVWVIKIIADLQAVGELEVLPNASPKGTNAYRIPTGKVSLPRMKSSSKLSLHKMVNSVYPNLSYESLAHV
jgi:hypothetical protein